MEIPFGEWKLRLPTLDDVESIARHANNRKIWLNLRDRFPHPYGPEDARVWIESQMNQEPVTSFMIASDAEAFGGISIHLQSDVASKSAEFGYWLGEPYWGIGIATGAVKALVEYAFEQFDLVRLYAKVFETNIGSCRVLEKAGFAQEGRSRKAVFKDGVIMDEFLYALVRE